MFDKILKLFNFTALPCQVWHERGIIWQFTKRAVESRYRGSILGLLWSFIHPLMMLFIYTFVFSIVFKARWNVSTDNLPGSFPVVMFAGMMMYNVFQEAVLLSCSSVTANQNLVKKVVFSVEVLPISQCLTTFILSVAWFPLLMLSALLVFKELHWTIILSPIVILPLLLFTMGVSFFISSLSVFVRDMQYVVGIVLQVLFFMTPVFYPVENVPERFRMILEFNPLSNMLLQGRQVMLFGEIPDGLIFLKSLLCSLVVLHLGYMWFRTTKKGFADVL